MKREELIQNVSKIIVQESPPSDTPPMDFFNYWIQMSGVKIENPEVATWLLDYMQDALTSDKEVLSYFI
ncbi:hypothetical protein [Hungatella hathewayi]|uniref:hypothetical protein n=1 Tax=Hungatella hathewayi TaxID=154046 RepID=UPI003569376B